MVVVVAEWSVGLGSVVAVATVAVSLIVVPPGVSGAMRTTSVRTVLAVGGQACRGGGDGPSAAGGRGGDGEAGRGRERDERGVGRERVGQGHVRGGVGPGVDDG